MSRSSLFDDLMQQNPMYAAIKCTHKKVTAVGYNDREEPSFDDSAITTEYFYAQQSEVPDYNSDAKKTDFADWNQEYKVLIIQGWRDFNAFVSDGVRDRVLVGSDSTEFEVFSVDIDEFWEQRAQRIFLRPLP